MVVYFCGTPSALVAHFGGRKKLSWSCYRLAQKGERRSSAKSGLFSVVVLFEGSEEGGDGSRLRQKLDVS